MARINLGDAIRLAKIKQQTDGKVRRKGPAYRRSICFSEPYGDGTFLRESIELNLKSGAVHYYASFGAIIGHSLLKIDIGGE